MSFAHKHKFDPYIAENWHSQDMKVLMDAQVFHPPPCSCICLLVFSSQLINC